MTARPVPRIRPLVVGVLTAGLLSTAFACGTSVMSLQVGQCVNDKEQDEETVSTLPVVDCAQPHTGEVYALPVLADGEFPGDAAVGEKADELCSGKEFEDYVGMSYEESVTHISSIVPSAESWDGGHREIVCLLQNEEGTPTTGSLRGSNR
jgi:hypothetical protein